MSLLRTSRNLRFLQSLTQPISIRPTLATQRYASSSQQPGQSVEGASGKSEKEAKPQILNQSPPKDGEASAEVNKHNEEMANRADKPSEKATDADVENDKVNKGFWSGE